MSSPSEYIPFMAEAIALARKGQFRTCPNPMVGAVLVADGRIVASGYHTQAGAPHAEIECLADAARKGINPRGKTIVVTLEPCRHHGKTPPCTDALLAAGIATLVYGCRDPNPEASGGVEILASAGVRVIGPVLQQECEDLLADFRIWVTTHRPYIFLKLAATLDGRIATRSGHSQWISGTGSRQEVHKLRAGIGKAGGAVLIGGSTFRMDNPLLTARDVETGRQPYACVITSRLPKPDADLKLLRDRPEATIFFASPAAAASTAADALRKLGCRVVAVSPDVRQRPGFVPMFQYLREELGCFYVLCEGGGHLALSILEMNLVDEFHLHLAPLILGDDEAMPLFRGRTPLSLDEALTMRICGTSICHGDLHVLLRPWSVSPCSPA